MEISNDTLNSIKKMRNIQLKEFIGRTYDKGYADGGLSLDGITLGRIRERFLKEPNFGPRNIPPIMAVLTEMGMKEE